VDVKDVRKVFKDAELTGREQVDAFVTAVSPVPAPELVKLLAILTDKALAADNAKHRTRCYAFLKLAEPVRDPQLFVHYTRALRAADAALRSVLVALLPRVNNVSAHGELCELLGLSDEATRQAAAKVLTELASAQAYKSLESLVAKKDFAGRMEAMNAIVPKAQHRAIPLLKEVLGHGKLHERSRALQYLGDAAAMQRDLPGAAQAVAVAMGDSDERVVCAAIVALSGLCDETLFLEHIEPLKNTQSLPLVRAIVEALRNYKSGSAIEWLTRKLRLGPNAIRLAALASLEAIGTDDVVPRVGEALRHPHLVVRNRAAEALSSLATQRKVELARTVIWLLRSRDVNVRRMAVELARKIGDPTGELTQKLLRFLRDEDWWVRERVADALVEMSGQNLTRYVVDYLTDESDVVRRYAVGFLKRLKDPRALGALVRTAQNDADWWTREWAIEAMAEIGDLRAAPYIADILEREPNMVVPCLCALGTLRAVDQLELVARSLSHVEADVRLEAARALGEIGDRAAVAALMPLLEDPEHRVATMARKVIGALDSVRVGNDGGTERAQTLLDRMLLATAQREADDLILAAGRRPYIKRHGKTLPLIDQVFSAEEVRSMLGPNLSVNQQLTLGQLIDVDFSYELKAAGLRFRAHVFQQRSGPSAIFRIVKQDIRPLEDLGVPKIVETFGDFANGLVLIGGPTGSGKSSTLAALIDYINRTSARHVVTMEDPIEVVHLRKQSLINQREIGTHTKSFGHALRATLRQDPDVILVGEMRDLETISFAVSAAETGHLVFGTVHTVSADTSVDRLINAFPPGQQPQVRAMLAETLRAVACQHLVRKQDGGRLLVAEVLINNDAVSNLIRKGKTYQIPSVVTTSREQGMQSMDVELARLVNEGVIAVEDGYAKANDKRAFEQFTGLESSDKSGDKPGGPPTGTKPSLAEPRARVG
jgi:twitching motility protein PilT